MNFGTFINLQQLGLISEEQSVSKNGKVEEIGV